MNLFFDLKGVERFHGKHPDMTDFLYNCVNAILYNKQRGELNGVYSALINTLQVNSIISPIGAIIEALMATAPQIRGAYSIDRNYLEIDFEQYGMYLRSNSSTKEIVQRCMEVFVGGDITLQSFKIAENTLIVYKILKWRQNSDKGADTTTNKKDKDIN